MLSSYFIFILSFRFLICLPYMVQFTWDWNVWWNKMWRKEDFWLVWIDDQMKYEPLIFGSSFLVLTTLFWIADDVWGRQWVWCLAQKMVGSSGEQTLLLEISRWGNKKGQTTTKDIRHSEPQWINIGILISDLRGGKLLNITLYY